MARRPIQFGYCVPIFASPGVIAFRTPSYEQLDVRTTMDSAELADDLGYDSLWVADHLFLGRDGAIMEGWTTLAALAGSTGRAKLGMIHLSNSFRTPSLMAKMSATLDQISEGRLIFFCDAGWQQREHDAYGIEFADAATRVERFREGIEIIRALWTTDGPVSYAGRHYRVENAVCMPKPVQRPHPPIWIGETREGLADVTAEYADGWNSVPATLAQYRTKLAAVEEACARRGRSIDALELSLETQILVAPNQSELRRIVDHIAALRESMGGQYDRGPIPDTHETLERQRDAWLVGTPDDIVDQLRAFAALRVSHFMLWFLDAPDATGMRLFADKVMPAFRS